ncbi:hypothetical protein CON42_08385 [Bacillus thuringiensis]|uniref:ATP-grasp domain-containing protein n=1 Tax=Bacillus thuringiensis TaxID=1428 RepID=UPI000BEC94E7|nr:ATP-grasp domain-containing protein [Bacillus thuringiensis]MED3053021.1 ATP-grasp domain-containing protein [Bacillus thuringiensis]PEA16651.1 hypothetical protein CON42_08385 [Bacillus thuringiensis]PFH77305.1 hypothetical protein COI56_06210 [Bacillus thuringiensis]
MKIGFIDSNLTGNGFEALRIAKELGYEVFFITRNLDEYLSIEGSKEYFDKYVDTIIPYKMNTSESVLESIENYHFDSILTFSDYHVVLAAEVAHKRKLLGLNPLAAARVRNKHLTRTKLQEYSIPSPRFEKVETYSQLIKAVEKIGFPCVVKPLDESASEGVRLCTTVEEVKQQFELLVKKIVNSRGQEVHKQILVEEYLLGPEVSVEVYVKEGETKIIGITDKKVTGIPYFVEIGHTFPSNMSLNLQQQCEEITIKALKAIEYNFGIAHVELKLTSNGPKIIEINGRPAGDHITDLIELSTGINLVKELILLSVGNNSLNKPIINQAASIHFITSEKKGTLNQVKGLELLNCYPCVKESKINVAQGEQLKDLKSNRERLGYVLTVGNDSYEAYRSAELAIAQIQLNTKNN